MRIATLVCSSFPVFSSSAWRRSGRRRDGDLTAVRRTRSRRRTVPAVPGVARPRPPRLGAPRRRMLRRLRVARRARADEPHCRPFVHRADLDRKAGLRRERLSPRRSRTRSAAPRSRSTSSRRSSDVTARIEAATRDSRARRSRTAKAEMSRSSGSAPTAALVRCDVVDLAPGRLYHLYRYRRFQDVRLVFAPNSPPRFSAAIRQLATARSTWT